MTDVPVLVFGSGPLEGEERTIQPEQIVRIGRAEANDIVLDDEDVSRSHAELRFDNGTLWLRDLGSRNGVFVNDRRVSTHKDLRVGDTVRIGASTFEIKWASERVVEPPPVEPPPKPRRSWFGLFDR